MKKQLEKIACSFKRLSIKRKLKLLRNGIIIPFSCLIIWVTFLLIYINNQYSMIINNVAAATEFNSDFRTDMDYKMYRIVAGAVTFDEVDPYKDIEDARVILNKLKDSATTQNSQNRIDAILRLLGQLEKIVDNIKQGKAIVGREDYVEVLDKDIYQFTELIDEKLSDYIRYEAEHAKMVMEEQGRQIKNSITFCVVLTISVVVLILVMTKSITQSIVKPILELCDSTKEVAKGNFSIQVQIDPMEEMEVLGSSFNSMIKKIGSLIEKEKNEQIHLRKTELKLLQAQINPHFLYNTLDTIIWLAEDKQNEQVVQMVDQLSVFFRTTLSKGRDFITLSEEESHVTSYLEIQQFRYRDILEYKVDIASDIQSFYILKICLQPIVENAIYHGLKGKRGKGQLAVTAYREGDYLNFSVKDTGRGMTEEELFNLKNQLEGSQGSEMGHGFGLLNVNERLCLTYGKESKLHINSTYNVGTEVYFKIPVHEKCLERG